MSNSPSDVAVALIEELDDKLDLHISSHALMPGAVAIADRHLSTLIPKVTEIEIPAEGTPEKVLVVEGTGSEGAVRRLAEERDNWKATVTEWVEDFDSVPHCSGEWLSGSGGHRKHARCSSVAVWWHPSDTYRYCDTHVPEHDRQDGLYVKAFWADLLSEHDTLREAQAMAAGVVEPQARRVEELIEERAALRELVKTKTPATLTAAQTERMPPEVWVSKTEHESLRHGRDTLRTKVERLKEGVEVNVELARHAMTCLDQIAELIRESLKTRGSRSGGQRWRELRTQLLALATGQGEGGEKQGDE